MLKRIFVLLTVLSVFVSFINISPAYSEEAAEEESSQNTSSEVLLDEDETTFEDAYADYIGLFEEYNKAHEEYVLKRAQYLKFLTLKSRQEAFDATFVMLEKRDEVVISYLKVLRFKLKEGRGITDEKKNDLNFRLEEEIEWYENHKANLSTTGSLEDLVSDSRLASNRQRSISPLAYETMALLAQGKVLQFGERTDEIYKTTKDKLEMIRNDEREEYSVSSTKFQVLDRWIFEADGKIVRSDGKQEDAEAIISNNIKKGINVISGYNTVISKLNESQLYLKETVLFIEEIIKQIKIKD